MAAPCCPANVCTAAVCVSNLNLQLTHAVLLNPKQGQQAVATQYKYHYLSPISMIGSKGKYIGH